MLENITWLGHDGFKIKDDKVIYIDPYELEDGEPADLILVTHDHYDHCSPQDIAKIQTEETEIVTIAACARKLRGRVHTVRPGDRLTVQGIEIEAVPAYNINKRFHPKGAGHVGFVVTVGGQRIYHAGDTDFIPEMREIEADIALLPVSGVYVMTAEEAAKAAEAIRPKVAVPMHHGSIVGSAQDARRFEELCPVEVQILEKGR
ncbi:MAG TPA: MBL fold metallo-hydrolase [Anaerolineae bacterium]|nr:MBL fold metallo-hydrolase [Anaerolineae bacterium]